MHPAPERLVDGGLYTILDIFYDCEPPLNILCQIVDVGQGRQRNELCLLIFT
jgi:hypothetical protein